MDLPEFKGGNPYFLLAVDTVGGGMFAFGPTRYLVVDLDEPGWMAEHGHIFRDVVDLHLVRKEGQVIVLSVNLAEGDQGYYVARHIGNTAFGETIVYGIGKKRADGNEDKLWVFQWGQVCAGVDVELFALQGLRAQSTGHSRALGLS